MNWTIITMKNIPLQGSVIEVKYLYKGRSFNYIGTMKTFASGWKKGRIIGFEILQTDKPPDHFLNWENLSNLFNDSDFTKCYWKIADKNKYMAYL